VTVVESSGHPALDSAAARGALVMEFEPAKKEGEPLRVWARVPVHFSKAAGPGAGEGPGEPGSATAGRSSGINPGAASGTHG